MRGVYVYADHQTGAIWGLRYENGGITARGEIVPPNPGRLTPSFAEDLDGELYVISFDGKVYEFEAK